MAESFEKSVVKAVQGSIIKKLSDDSLFEINYNDRVKIGSDKIREVYSLVDWNKIMGIVREKIELHIADKIVNNLATELGTDIKQIMCNTELREDLRATLRGKIRDSVQAVSK